MNPQPRSLRVSFSARTLAVLVLALPLSGCAPDPNAGGGVLTSNAAKVHVYTPEEQAGMTTSGTIPTMLTPSELRAHFENACKASKPTGEVNCCDAGLAQLIQARRNEALAATVQACGGDTRYGSGMKGWAT